jgi:formylmethanofuran dehydrogenase subunit A
VVEGREFIVQPSYDRSIEEYLRPLFEEYYTVTFDNYPVEVERLEGADIRKLG